MNCDTILKQLEGWKSPPLSHALPEARAVLEDSPPAQEQKKPSGVYAPFWHAKTERIVGSVYLPRMPRAFRRLPDRDYYAPGAERAQDDIHHFNATLADAYKLHKAGQNIAILFSLNFNTFCAPEFGKEYMPVLRQTPTSLTKYLTPRFVRIPPGTPPTLLASRVQMLRTIFKHVVLQARAPVDLRSLQFVPCSILATSWKDIAQIVNRDARAAEKAASTFCQSARTISANSLIDGVDSPAAFEIALCAVAEFLSGIAVCPPETASRASVRQRSPTSARHFAGTPREATTDRLRAARDRVATRSYSYGPNTGRSFRGRRNLQIPIPPPPRSSPSAARKAAWAEPAQPRFRHNRSLFR